MPRQHAKHHSKTTTRRKHAVRGHKASHNRRSALPMEGKGPNPSTDLPSAVEFLEIDVIGPLDAGLEDEESEFSAAEIDEG